MGAVRNRIMGWAYGTDALLPMMKLIEQLKVSQEEFQKNFAVRSFLSCLHLNAGFKL